MAATRAFGRVNEDFTARSHRFGYLLSQGVSDMTRTWKIVLGVAGLAFAATAASAAWAQTTGDQATPKDFNWEIKDGKRVPKGQRQTNADGSWREEIRQGKSLPIKDKSAAGEYNATRSCN
jgi:hypothetical protein